MRGILRTALIGCVVLGSVTVADEVRAVPGTEVTAGRCGCGRSVAPAAPCRRAGEADQRGRS